MKVSVQRWPEFISRLTVPFTAVLVSQLVWSIASEKFQEDNARLCFVETRLVGSDKRQLRGEEQEHDAEETDHFDR